VNFKDMLRNNPFTVAMIIFATLVSGITFVYSKALAIIELIIVIGIVIGALKWMSAAAARKKDLIRSVEESIMQSGEQGKYTSSFPFPLLLVDLKGNIEWFNSEFEPLLDGFKDLYSDNIASFLPEISDRLCDDKFSPIEVSCNDKKYTVHLSHTGDSCIAMYFVDDTLLKDIRTQFTLTRPAVLLINIDSLENTEDTLSHADYYSVVSDIEKIITKWLVENKCVFRKFADGKFMALTESANLDVMIKRKFQILDKIRTYTFDDKEMDITLSVGIGRDDNFCDCEVNARQALDMARGRGGDQVAVKIDENYEFFGGLTSRKEKRGKIKSRVISAALSEYIEKSNAVYVMGHKYSDFDAIGACVGIAAVARAQSKPVYIVVNESLSLAIPLINYLKGVDSKLNFISPESAVSLVTHESLVVVADTMRSQLVEEPRLLTSGANIILVDHHRKTVDYIDDVKLAFHEPYASSACEMVTELIQYSPSAVKLQNYEAEALLSGILLDTKNYTLRVGVRTFEAAAFLKDQKADTVTVKKLFAATVDENISVNKLIASASFFSGYAIAVADDGENVSRLVSSKTADELLAIRDVDASFVISTNSETVFISARSLGKINVQLIMEKFGGGGHQSMAACQIPGNDIKEAFDKLKAVVDFYLSENS